MSIDAEPWRRLAERWEAIPTDYPDADERGLEIDRLAEISVRQLKRTLDSGVELNRIREFQLPTDQDGSAAYIRAWRDLLWIVSEKRVPTIATSQHPSKKTEIAEGVTMSTAKLVKLQRLFHDSAELCRIIARNLDYKPAKWFDTQLGIQAARLRKAHERGKIRTHRINEKLCYSVSDAEKLWPEDVN